MNIREEYDAVNAMLKLFGEDPIQMLKSGTSRRKLQHLLDSYLEKLYIRGML